MDQILYTELTDRLAALARSVAARETAIDQLLDEWRALGARVAFLEGRVNALVAHVREMAKV